MRNITLNPCGHLERQPWANGFLDCSKLSQPCWACMKTTNTKDAGETALVRTWEEQCEE